jgi:ribosome-associated protein
VTASDHALELAIVAARAASGKLANDVVAIDVSEHLVITDVFVLASAPNDRQVKAIVEGVEVALNAAGVKPIRREGERDGRWVLLDFGEIVVHVQHAEERTYYSLERLWKDCPTIELPADVTEANNAARVASSESDDAREPHWSDAAGSTYAEDRSMYPADGSSSVSGVPGATGA